jgi:superfamily II DNA or RNA helicase
MILRQYQTLAVQWCNRQLNNTRHPLLVGPTGTGKTVIIGQLAKDRIELKNRLLLLVPQLEIHEQFMAHLTQIGLNPGYINDEGVMGRNRSIKFCRSFSEIIIDECHHSSAQSYRNIFDHFSHCQRVGFTATPYRMDNKPLSEFYTDMYEAIKMTEAVERGYLCKPVILLPDEYKEHVPDIEINDINIDEQKEHVHDKKIIGDLLKIYKDVFNGLPVIIPCSTHEHARFITEYLKSDGWQVSHIHSKLNKTTRKIIIHKIKTGQTNILVTVGVGVEGMDIPGLYGIIWLRQTMSLTIYMQFNGRPMRPAKGKDKFIMVDMVGNSVLHGRPDIDRKWSLTTDYKPGQDISDQPKQKICPNCTVGGIAHNALSCWICGYDFETGLLDGKPIDKKLRRLPQFVDGNLVYLDKEENCASDGNMGSIVHNNSNDYINNTGEQDGKVLKKHEKVEILKKDLTGLKIKSKFKEGLKWL